MFSGMTILTRLLAAGAPLVFLASCANRSEFVPEGGPVTVGMPSELSDRERTYVGEVDGALRGVGYQPVRHGAGELKLEFRISEGPINTDTTIELLDGRTVLAEGRGRGSGVPMIGRDKVAERSFQKAFGDFQAALPGAEAARVPGGAPEGNGEEMEYVY
jgi:hypothetical protein